MTSWEVKWLALGHTARTVAFRIPELEGFLKKKRRHRNYCDKANVGKSDYNKFDTKISVVHHKERKSLAVEWEKIRAIYIATKNLYSKYIKNLTSQ